MKNSCNFSWKILTFLIIFVSTFSCKKENTGSTGCSGQESGFGNVSTRSVMFWISEDTGCGPLKLVKLTNKSGKSFTTSKKIDIYYASQPLCGDSGTLTMTLDKNYTYQYTFSCDNRNYSGEFTIDCDNTCVAVKIE